MKRFEFSAEVGPIDAETVDRLKADGYTVLKGTESWRIQRIAPVIGEGSIRDQAHTAALEAIRRYSLTQLSDPPALSLRDPDTGSAVHLDPILEDARRAYDASPRPRPKRKWYQKAMELGLGERKGD